MCHLGEHLPLEFPHRSLCVFLPLDLVHFLCCLRLFLLLELRLHRHVIVGGLLRELLQQVLPLDLKGLRRHVCPDLFPGFLHLLLLEHVRTELVLASVEVLDVVVAFAPLVVHSPCGSVQLQPPEIQLLQLVEWRERIVPPPFPISLHRALLVPHPQDQRKVPHAHEPTLILCPPCQPEPRASGLDVHIRQVKTNSLAHVLPVLASNVWRDIVRGRAHPRNGVRAHGSINAIRLHPLREVVGLLPRLPFLHRQNKAHLGVPHGPQQIPRTHLLGLPCDQRLLRPDQQGLCTRLIVQPQAHVVHILVLDPRPSVRLPHRRPSKRHPCPPLHPPGPP
mmetsp:Transcript_28307/g.70066  ORF Transcript_28307/g.70066 Transcript_28307/m.70066 type:complete len:335 (+) Transcript_28307:108-1112(+)